MKRTPLQDWIAVKCACSPERLNRAVLEAYQLQKLQETLRLAVQKSPFYRRHLAGINPNLPSLAALADLPFCSASDIRREGMQFLCVSQDDIQRVVSLNTSGTSGEPKRFFFTHADQDLTVDFFGVGMSTLTAPGDRVLILLPGERPGSVGDLLFKGLQQMGAVPFKHGPVQDPPATLKRIIDERINVLVGVPVQMLALVRYFETISPRPAPALKSILLSTDYVPDSLIRTVQNAWNCPVFNHYGMTETGLGGGVTCEAQQGYHLREADLYYEIVDPLTGRVLQDGQEGEVVFTTLTRRGMPLIRYRSGDISRFVPEPCACGSFLKLMQPVKHRVNGRIKLPQGWISIADLDEALLGEDGVLDYEAALERGDDRTCLKLEIYVSRLTADCASRLYACLMTVAVLQEMLRRDQAALSLKIEEGFPPFMGRMSKRRILETFL